MRFIRFFGEISREKVLDLLQDLRSDYGKGLVLINSPGGTFEFFSVLAPSLMRTGFISIGSEVESSALFLHLLGRERLAKEDSTFFFHEVRVFFGLIGEVSVYDLEQALEVERGMKRRWKRSEREFAEWLHSQMVTAQSWALSFIAERTGFPAGRFANLMRSEVTLSAHEAVQYGIVHRVISDDEFESMKRYRA